MNARLEGWRLALAVLIPTLIIGAAFWFAIQALANNDNTSVSTSEPLDLAPTATSTPLPATSAPIEPTVVPSPTPLALPSAEAIVAVPTATLTPEPDETSAPTPTQAPQPTSPPRPAGPTATPTVDPSLVAVSCSGATFPLSVEVDETLPLLSAIVTPADMAAAMTYQWSFGNNHTVGAQNTGSISYDAVGTYTITFTATESDGTVHSASCGTVTVGKATAAVSNVACAVRPKSSTIKWADATLDTLMRVTTTWKPTDQELTLQYEFEINDPIIFSNDAVSGDSLEWTFATRTSTVDVFWRDETTGETGRISCDAFESPTAPTGTPTPTPTTYNGAGV